ncbi:hypothetical protein ACHAWU_004490 [Discostella pseudostelligera]|uniref:Uncharacterized protein n=1 Tax=Discostella pseudostelligera TaxID=259834 RepID=A0ABD3M123_9STRA
MNDVPSKGVIDTSATNSDTLIRDQGPSLLVSRASALHKKQEYHFGLPSAPLSRNMGTPELGTSALYLVG